MSRTTTFIPFFCCFSTSFFAQDSHYWTQQAGVRGMFNSGAIVSGSYENSAIYYNPAALAFVDESNLTVNLNAYRYEALVLKNGAGDSLDLASRRISLYPQMTSSLLTKNPEKPFKMAFAVITRQQANWDMTQRYQTYSEILPQSDSADYYIGNMDYQNTINETWIGLGGGYKIHKHLSVGFSSFVSYRNQRYRLNLAGRASFQDAHNQVFIASSSQNEEIRLNNLKWINKLSVHGHWENWKFGLVVTLPSVNIAGWSRAQREIFFENMEGNVSGILSDQQKNLPSNFKYPFAVAAGVSYQFKKTYLGISAEYFSKIRLYQMIVGTPREVHFPSSLNLGVKDFCSFWNYANAVANVGVGMEQELNDILTLHLGFRTDFSYYRHTPNHSSEQPILISSNLDLYHLSSGISWKRKASLLSLGFNLSFGWRNHVSQFVNLTSPTYSNLLLGTTNNTSNVSSSAFTFLVGYTYFFALK